MIENEIFQKRHVRDGSIETVDKEEVIERAIECFRFPKEILEAMDSDLFGSWVDFSSLVQYRKCYEAQS